MYRKERRDCPSASSDQENFDSPLSAPPRGPSLIWVRFINVVLFLVLVTRGRAQDHTDESHARLTAADLVRKNLGVGASHQLRVTRREDWEDRLFRFQMKITGQIAKAAYFFEVTETGTFVLSPNEAVTVVSNHGQRSWVVAVSTKTGSAYGLDGFPGSTTEFRRLIADARVNIRSTADALEEVLLFFTTVSDPGYKQVVSSPRELRRKVEDYYEDKLPELQAESQANAWWKQFTAANLSNRLGWKSDPVAEGFAVSFTHIQADHERIEVFVSSFRVSRNGAFESVGTSQLYRSR